MPGPRRFAVAHPCWAWTRGPSAQSLEPAQRANPSKGETPWHATANPPRLRPGLRISFIAWHVVERGEKAFWSKAGASWLHKDGKGMTLQLEVMPINGRIILRQPAENRQEEA